MNQKLIEIVSKLFATICLIEIISAFILNPLVLFICLKSKRLRSTSTFKLLAVNAINDILICYPWNQENFAITFFDYFTSNKSLIYCRLVTVFLQTVTLNIETWILLSISIDRLLTMVVKNWKKVYFSGYRPYIYSGVLCLLIAGINFHSVFTVGYSYYNNDTQKEMVLCYITNPEYNSINWFDFNGQVS